MIGYLLEKSSESPAGDSEEDFPDPELQSLASHHFLEELIVFSKKRQKLF
jgi:hypothetical protein